MARGFAKGLFQGVILCGAAVAALSLALPQPGKRSPASGESGPSAESIGLPVGSEFARGEDEQPQAPSALSRPNVPSLGEAAAVAPPPDEARPAPATATAGRPETPVQGPAAPVAMAPVNDPVDLPAAPAREVPIPVAPPGRVETPSLDRQPERQATESPPAPASGKDAARKADAGTPDPAVDDAEAAPRPPEAATAPRRQGGVVPMLAPVSEAARDSAPPQDAPAAEEPIAEEPATAEPATAEPAPEAASPVAQAPERPAATDVAAKPSNSPDLTLPPDLNGLRLFDRN